MYHMENNQVSIGFVIGLDYNRTVEKLGVSR